MSIASLTDELVSDLAGLTFALPVTHVYNPLVYARSGHDAYVHLARPEEVEAIFLGMNPGPWGMAQTGIPFGEISAVRDWLGLRFEVGQPTSPHPKRPVTGLECPRREVSGARLWGWAEARFGTPRAFFSRFYMANYCPLSFMESGGKNRTPDKLPKAEREPLFDACNRHLRGLVELLQPQWVIGVGAFAESRAVAALGDRDVRIGRILHPSPASPIANRGWAPQAEVNLRDLGISLPD